MPDDSLLHDLIEGDLSESERQSVFARLHADPELQRRYLQLNRLNDALVEDAHSVAVPLDVTAAIYAAVGVPLPAPRMHAPTAAIRAPVGESGATGWSGATWGAVIVAGLCLLGLVVHVVWNRSEGTSDLIEHNRLSAGTVAPEQQGGAEWRAPDATNRAGSVRERTTARVTAPRHQLPSAPGRVVPEPAPPVLMDSTRPEAESGPMIESVLSTASIVSVPDAVSPVDVPGVSMIRLRNALPISGWFISIRGFAGSSIPSVSIAAQSAGGPRDVSLSAGRVVSENGRAGLEFGRETIAQYFSHLEADGYARYWQTPLEYWLTAYYEHALMGFFDRKLLLVSRINAGAAFEIGPMMRAGLHARLPIARQFEISCGGEAALTLYRFESAWLTSKRISAVGGLTVRF
jgi:hypothetical protein